MCNVRLDFGSGSGEVFVFGGPMGVCCVGMHVCFSSFIHPRDCYILSTLSDGAVV